MARKNNSRSIALKRNIVVLAVILLAITYIAFVLEKTKVTDFYKKPTAAHISNNDAVRPVNNVVYTPATTAESEEADRIKAAAQEKLTATPTPTGNKIDVSLSAAGQDTRGGPIIVRAILGTTGGQCKLTISDTSTAKEFTAEVANMGTYYSCVGFDVPVTELPAGTYQVMLTVTNGSAMGSVTQQIEVIK